MSKVTFTSITVGEGQVFIGPDQATVDADITTLGVNSQYNVGSTQNGVMIGWEPNMVDIEVDQFGDAARIVQSSQKITIKTTIAEATLANLANAWGYATGQSVSQPGLVTGYALDGSGRSVGTLNVGIHSVYPSEKYVRVEGNAPGSNAAALVYRSFKTRRCISYTAVEWGMQRADNQKYAVEFRALPDTSQTGHEYGTIVDATSAPYTPY